MTAALIQHGFVVTKKNLLRPSFIVFGGFLMISMVFFRPLLMSLLLIAIGAVSIIYKRYVSIGIDFELCSLCAIAIGSAYGMGAGAISGGISIFLALLLNGQLLENAFFTLIKVATYSSLGIIAGIFYEGNLVLIAGLYTFFADVLFVVIAANSGGNIGKLAIFLITHTFIVVYQLRLLLPITRALL